MLDDRVKVIDKENSGVSDTRNIGVENANGKYILFIDSDDFIDTNMINIMYNTLKENEVDVVRCSCNIVKDNKILSIENNPVDICNKKIPCCGCPDWCGTRKWAALSAVLAGNQKRSELLRPKSAAPDECQSGVRCQDTVCWDRKRVGVDCPPRKNEAADAPFGWDHTGSEFRCPDYPTTFASAYGHNTDGYWKRS